MNRKFEILYQSLERIAALYTNLLETLQSEHAAMLAVDVKTLAEVTQTKQAVLEEIYKTENERVHLVNDLVVDGGIAFSGNQPSLLEIAAACPAGMKEKFEAAHLVLNMCVDKCKSLNRDNLELAQSSLERIEAMKRNILGMSNNNSENYNSQGSRNPTPGQGGRLVSQRA